MNIVYTDYNDEAEFCYFLFEKLYCRLHNWPRFMYTHQHHAKKNVSLKYIVRLTDSGNSFEKLTGFLLVFFFSQSSFAVKEAEAHIDYCVPARQYIILKIMCCSVSA